MRIFRQKEFYFPFLAWLLVFVWYLVSFSLCFDGPRKKCRDFIDYQSFTIFHRAPEEVNDIVIVEVDGDSLYETGQRWPWKRSLMAELTRSIFSYNPRTVGFDIVFTGESEIEEDLALESAFRECSPIVLACTLLYGKRMLPFKKFAEAVYDTGFVNLPREGILLPTEGHGDNYEEEAVAREVALFAGEGRDRILSFPIAMISAYLGLDKEQVEFIQGKGMRLGERLFIPSRSGVVQINYLANTKHEMRRVSASDILQGKVEKKMFEDKLVLVGVTEILAHDYAPTPLGLAPGVTINANIMAMLLSGRFIKDVPLWLIFVFAFILGVSTILCNIRFSALKFIIITGFIYAAVFFSVIVLRIFDIRTDLFSLFFPLSSAWLCTVGIKYGSLLYFSQRVKDLAVRDPDTGFFTPRFFVLKIDEQLKNRSAQSALLVFTLAEYNKLVLAHNFEEIKSLFKSVAGYFETMFKRQFPGVLFSRVFSDSIAVFFPADSLSSVKDFLHGFLSDLKKVEFKSEENNFPLSFISRGVFKPRGGIADSRAVLSQIEVQKDKVPDHGNPGFVLEKVEVKVWEGQDRDQDTDMLDFLVKDVESKNRELEKILKDLIQSKKDTESAYFETIRSLIKALEEKDTYTQGHSERVARYSRAIADAAGLSAEECDIVYKAGLLHDIGKIGVPDYILRKKEELSEEDYNMIKRHVLISAEILRPVKHFQNLIPIVLAHHERYDGTGYPYGLGADMISEGGLILAVADAFDAITCGRGYKSGLSVSDAIKEMEKGKGAQFSPEYVDILRDLISSGRLKLTL